MTIKFQKTDIGYNKVLIRDFNYELASEKFIMLIGRNGTGKSCLLKTIAGLCSLIVG
jgi:ABC-type Mn2+/Zn2+ transport system ATPase subunit